MVRRKIKRKLEKKRREKGIIKLPKIEWTWAIRKSHNYTHVAAFLLSNAGDVLLPVTLQDIFKYKKKRINWNNIHAHWEVTDKTVDKINQTKGLIIGGGGLFLKDTNPNNLSGWQWSCSIENLKKIKVPIVVFAVGYNRFPGQEDFDPIFKEHISLLAKKSEYIGLRNSGSIDAIRSYMPKELHSKIRFQPCMTTVISKLYPGICNYEKKKNIIALNCAFDRAKHRFGKQEDKILLDIANACKELSKDYEIVYFAHTSKDLEMITVLEKTELKFKIVNFVNLKPKDIIKAYSKVSLVIGMRGHSQMIPFGCLTPILSLVSHDKLQWFLDDINQPDWGVDVKENNLKDIIVEKSKYLLNNQNEIISIIKREQERLWAISLKNVLEFIR